MKQMICLLSDQLIPTYLAVKHERPHRLWRVLSDEMVKSGKDTLFCNAVRQYVSNGIELPDCSALVAKPDNFVSTKTLIDGLFSQFSSTDADWHVNVTGGNKMMSSGALLAAVIKDAKISYTEFSAPTQLLDARTGLPTSIDATLTVAEFLGLYGFATTSKTPSADRDWIEFAYQLAANPPRMNVLPLSNNAEADASAGGLRQYENFLYPAFRKSALGRQLGNLAGGPDLTNGQVRFITGEWLELFIFDVLERYRTELRLSDLQYGVQALHENVSNDLDVGLTRDANFFYIECKSGSQWKKKPSDQIEESRGTLARLRALRAKALIVTTSTIFLRDQNRLAPAAAARLREGGMNILTRGQITELANNHDDPGVAVRLLEDFLDGSP